MNARPCEICQQPIEAERLEAVPETRLCVAHGREIQKHGGEFLVSFSQERTSKPGSLKRNYGGVTPHKSRNETGLRKLRAEYEQRKRAEGGG